MITKVTSPKTSSTKNLYGKAGWMKVRFEDLVQKIENKKYFKSNPFFYGSFGSGLDEIKSAVDYFLGQIFFPFFRL